MRRSVILIIPLLSALLFCGALNAESGAVEFSCPNTALVNNKVEMLLIPGGNVLMPGRIEVTYNTGSLRAVKEELDTPRIPEYESRRIAWKPRFSGKTELTFSASAAFGGEKIRISKFVVVKSKESGLTPYLLLILNLTLVAALITGGIFLAEKRNTKSPEQ